MSLADYTIDQMAGALALTLGSVGGLCLILFKSRCETISICWGVWSCNRKVSEEDPADDKDKAVTRSDTRKAEALMPDLTSPQSQASNPQPSISLSPSA